MSTNTITLCGEWDEKPYVRVWIDRRGKVRFSPLLGREEGWNFMASMYVSMTLGRSGVESGLKKRYKKTLAAGKDIPKAAAGAASLRLAKRLNKQRIRLGGETLVARTDAGGPEA